MYFIAHNYPLDWRAIPKTILMFVYPECWLIDYTLITIYNMANYV